MSPKINETNWGQPPGFYYEGERIGYRLGERFGDAVARHKAAKQKAPTAPAALAAPKAAEPDRRAAQDAAAAELKALAADTAELRALVDRQSPASPPAPTAEKPAAKERTGFAGRVKVGGGFKAFGAHEQRSAD